MWCRSRRRWSGSGRRPAPIIHLDIEPEPDCTIENTDETLDFFERRLLPIGAPLLARALGSTSTTTPASALLEHIRVCFDCCHFAVEFERPAEALDRIRAAGIRIGRIQLSSALDVTVPADPGAAADVMARLRPFADTTYLHQVVERRPSELRHYLDLPDALDAPAALEPRTWRIHFHVPLFTSEYGALGSTQSYVAEVLEIRDRHQRHAPPRDRDLHLGRAAGRPQDGSPRVDRPRIRLGAAHLRRALRLPQPVNAEDRRSERRRPDR